MTTIDLAGVWKLRGEFIDVGPERYQEVLDRPDGPFMIHHKTSSNVFPSRTGFIDATVPGDVITALVENNIIEEPTDKLSTTDCLWIRDLSWWFTRNFDIDEATLAEDSVRLYIEMLDFKADIIINNRPVARHRNAFCAFNEDVRRYLKPGSNNITIRLTSGIEDHYPKDSISFYCASPNAIADQRVHLRKPQFTYGWDWCQPVPTCGIGRAIRLEASTAAEVSVARVDTIAIDGPDADVKFVFEITKTNMTASESCILEYELLDGYEVIHRGHTELLLNGGLNFFEEAATLKNLELWWPNGYGDPHLYTLHTRVICRGITHESVNRHIGIRTIKIDQTKLPDNTRNFYFCVNGVRIFCKGGNWVPTDSVYLRTTDARYRILVEEAKAANFTMLRMWGGGTYEPACFYEYCSEYGILLMHDFMYACGFYPDLDQAFLFEALREAEFQTKRLAPYPCMAVWTGNNEIHESYTDWFPEPIRPERFHGEKIFNYIQPEAVKRNSPTIPYMPSSPYMGNPRANQVDEGDVHAWTYLGRDPETKFKFIYELEAFDRMPARFSSEYGFFGALMESSVKRYHGDEAVVRNGAIWLHHGEQDRKRGSIDQAINRHLRSFDQLGTTDYLLYSGIMQGLLYLEMAEAIRQKSYGAGDLIWMYNDCWPETGWSIIDYYLTRKISFYYLKRAFATKQLIIRQHDGSATLTVINESPESFSATVEYGYMHFDGDIQSSGEVVLSIKPHSWQQLKLDLEGDLHLGFYYARDIENGFATADSLRAYYRNYDFPEASFYIDSVQPDGEDMLVTVHASAYVPVAYLRTSDDRTHFSDNYFKLYPNEAKTIRIFNCHETPTLHSAAMEPGIFELSSEFQEAAF